jgi:predicted RNA-binding Zn ribbon-like protein
MFVRCTFSLVSVSAASILFGLVTFEQSAAQDVRHICSEKYQSAKAAGTLNDETWPQFYSRCTKEAKENAAVAEATAAPPLDTRHICSEKYQAARAAGKLLVDDETWPQFYSRCTTEAKANAAAAEATAAPPLDIRHICSEKYQAAKAAGTLNGETWPQFYSRCTAETKANPPAITATPAAPVVTPPVVAAPAPPAEEVPAAPVAEAPAPPPAVEAPAAPVVAPAPAKPPKTPASKPVAPTVAAAPSTAVFPSAISPTYANEKPYKARLKTCSDQYKVNKAVNANGGLKWIQKGGGYWSECDKHLQG